MSKILLIDDEPAIQHAFRKAFHPPQYETRTARTAKEGIALFEADCPNVIVLDIHLPDADGLEAFKQIRERDARVPIVLITGHGTADLAIEAMKRGAFDYLLKPIQYDRLKGVIDQACASSRLMTTPTVLDREGAQADVGDVLVGKCEAMQEMYKAIGQVAGTDTTVLIDGESGTGKELVARAIYQHSQRADQRFMVIHCGAIPEALVESELFGHEKGAFTGADRRRIGKFEQCSGGTLFLDEIGEMPLLAQVKLLRVLQEQQFERVGGNETIQTNVRVIAATNADLNQQVALERFRRDLYFRLNVFSIRLPPLRERGADIELLTDFYLARYSREFGRSSSPIVADSTREALSEYSWPGNVRELQSVLKQAVLRMTGSTLLSKFLTFTSEALTDEIPAASTSASKTTGLDWTEFIQHQLESGARDIYANCLEQMERQLLLQLLEHTDGNQLRTAELLGINRGSLRHKLRTYGISPNRTSQNAQDEPTA